MSKSLDRKNYLVIADWMLELGLNTRELLTYALIYGFCQDKESCYYGSLEYLACWLGIKDRTNATRYLKPLVEKGLVTKEDVRTKINQKACIYRTLINRGDPTKDADVDYIIIQPWMIQNLHLNGKDLLLYALVHSYSRKGSDNFCSYKKEYFAKWLQCRKDHLDRQIKKAIDKYLIKAVEGGFVAIVPSEISNPQTDNTPNFEEFDFTQIDNTFTHSDNTSSPKLTTNNLVLDNLKDILSFVVVKNDNNSPFNIELFREKALVAEFRRGEAFRFNDEYKQKTKQAYEFISNVVDNYGIDNIKLINELSEKQCRYILDETYKLLDGGPLADSIYNPQAKLSSKIKKYLINIKNKR